MKAANAFDWFKQKPNQETCKDPEHIPPNYIYIPPGEVYIHMCSSCQKKSYLKSGVIY